MTVEATTPELLDVPVAGGTLRVAAHRPSDGSDQPLVLGLHGVTASSVSLQPVARSLAGRAVIAAPDLRGRGASAELPPPYGMNSHADDCAAVIETLGLGPAIVVGESMGGYVAVVLAARYPELVRSVVLVDGGIPLPAPEGIPVETIMAAVLGPALARLEMTFGSVEEYFEFWKAHPAFVDEWSADIEDYLRYDLTGDPPELRSRVSADAVKGDTTDQLTNPTLIADALGSVKCPIHLLRATRGLLNQPEPLLPDAIVDPWLATLPQLSVETVDDTNHYTLMFGQPGVERIVAAIDAQTSS